MACIKKEEEEETYVLERMQRKGNSYTTLSGICISTVMQNSMEIPPKIKHRTSGLPIVMSLNFAFSLPEGNWPSANLTDATSSHKV